MHFAARPGISDLSVLIALLLGSITLTHTRSALADPMSRPADAQSVGLHAAFPSALPGTLGLAPPQRMPSRLERVGEAIFNDRTLSEPKGTACISCHLPGTGFANNNGSRSGVALGSTANSIGTRNAMSNFYSHLSPAFSFRVAGEDIDPIGGLFWDGRADTLAQQALGPFLNAKEMNNPNAASVVAKIAKASYAKDLMAEFGPNVFKSPELAFQKVGVAIAAFESREDPLRFSSKYDHFIQGNVQLTASEARGLKTFMDPVRGNCAVCHTMNPASKNPRDSLFTDFAHYAEGIPRNPKIPANVNPSRFDLGLCGPDRNRPALPANVPGNISIEKYCGTFKMPSLRNVAEREAFMHNGFFTKLRDVVSFYATRNSDPKRWYGPAGLPNDLPAAYVANILQDRAPFDRPANAGPALTEREIDDLLAFLGTLSDGFQPPKR